MKPVVHVILRFYNAPKVLELIQRLSLSNIRPDSITAVIDTNRDSTDTPKLISENTSFLPIRVLPLCDWGWSKALNAAIASLPAPSSTVNEFIMAISNDVQIEKDGIEMLLRSASKKDASCGYALFEDRNEPSYTVPRNTCALWKRMLFSTVGPFNELLDPTGGMEDYEMAIRAFSCLHLLPFTTERRMGRSNIPDAERLIKEEKAMKNIEIRYSNAGRYSNTRLKKLKAHLYSERKSHNC